jgi:hypothetical protein
LTGIWKTENMEFIEMASEIRQMAGVAAIEEKE